jgi:hypothetical protein
VLRILRWLGMLLAGIVVLFASAWWVLAIWYGAPDPGWLHWTLAGAYAVVVLALFAFARPLRRALLVWVVLVALLTMWWSTKKPSNDRDWAPDVARLPWAERHGDELVFHDVRDAEWTGPDTLTPRYVDRTVDLSRLLGADLFMCYWGSPSIAHTIVSWEFEDVEPIAISIETRKRRGQEYSAVAGFFKQYELIYVVATERDLIRVRASHRGEEIYLYRLDAPPEAARALLLDYVDSINGLREQPKFYDALVHNCTTTIRRHVTHIDPGAPPFDWRMLVNGRGDELLYEHGRIDNSMPFEELRALSRVDGRARFADQDPAFSQRIRERLPDRKTRRG